MALYNAKVNFSGAGSVTGTSAIQKKVPITSPSKYTESSRLGQVVFKWNIETGQKVIPGESFMVRGGDIGEVAEYSAYGSFRSAIYTYTLKYNLNGASSPSSIPNSSNSLESVSPEMQAVNTQITRDTVPSKTNTTFAGWALANNTTQNLKNPGDGIRKWFTPNGADQSAVQNLYAVWQIYQRFNANGGNFPSGSTTWNEKTGRYQTTGYTFTIPAGGPSRTGYEFLGWSQSSTATTPYIAKSSSTQTVFLTKDTTWYAVWRAQYIIEYKKGDGTGTEVTEYKSEDVSYTLKGQIFTKTGYDQTGWSTTNGGPKAYNLKATYTENASLTLYPYWTPKKYNVLYKNNSVIKGFEGKISDFPTDTTVSCGQSYQIPTKIPSCPYFWFNTNNPSNYNIWKDQGNTEYKPGDSFAMPAYDITLTAQWVRKKANILYDKGDGQPVSGSTNVDQGESINLWDKDAATSNYFTKPGYVLAYWKYKNQGYELGGSFIVDDITNGGNIILTAVWIPIAQYRYPDYGASVYGARVIYDPDYIIEGGN